MKTRSKENTPAGKMSKSISRGKKPTPKAKKKKKLASNDPVKPKKPPTAFFYFLDDFRKTYQKENPDVKSMDDFRKTYQKENPDVKSMCEIGKVCGEKWKTMTYEEKVAYYDIATEKRAEFEKAMSDYLKRKENGDLSDESYD